MFLLLTSSTLFFTENPYVSLNKLQAMRPQGTIGELLAVTASGLQSLVTSSLALLLNCLSLLLLTYLIIVLHIPGKFPNISRKGKKKKRSKMINLLQKLADCKCPKGCRRKEKKNGAIREFKLKSNMGKVLHSHENN